MPASTAFQIFGFDHLASLLVLGVCSFGAYKLGQGDRSRAGRLVGLLVFSSFALFLTVWRVRDGFQAELDLPLWLCDVVFFLCAYCFWKPGPITVTLVTFWGLAGTLQALITPDLQYGFPSWEFALFFFGHSVIVVGVFFLLGEVGDSIYLGWQGVGVAFGGLVIYSGVIGSLDRAFGWNYGYLLRKPQGASVLDFLGPWPVYVLAGHALALVLFALLSAFLTPLLGRREPA